MEDVGGVGESKESRLAAVLISPFEAKCVSPGERTVCPGMANRESGFPPRYPGLTFVVTFTQEQDKHTHTPLSSGEGGG